MAEQDTRDLAVDTASQMKSHIIDCFEVRKRNEKKLDQIEIKLDKIMWYIPLIIGGIIMASRGIDLIISYLMNK